jgi:predicted phosphodiesterase
MQTLNDSVMDLWVKFRTGNDAEIGACMYIPPNAHALVRKGRNDLPPKADNVVRFIIISDTHSRHACLGHLPPGDIFVHCGDILMSSRYWSGRGRREQYAAFNDWLGTINCGRRIVIAGNHDLELESLGRASCQRLLHNCEYLEHSSTVVLADNGNEIVLFGSPVSRGSSRNSAFQSADVSEEAVESAKKVAAEANGRPVMLLTHGSGVGLKAHFGRDLLVYITGHIHEHYGSRRICTNGGIDFISISASIMDARYRPTHLPIVLDLAL